MLHYVYEEQIVQFVAADGIYLIGFTHADNGEGHAVGTFNTGNTLRAYDPNEGFWNLAGAQEYEAWVRDRLDHYCLTYDFFEVCLYRAAKTNTAMIGRVFGQ
jgi:hypothetical protein